MSAAHHLRSCGKPSGQAGNIREIFADDVDFQISRRKSYPHWDMQHVSLVDSDKRRLSAAYICQKTFGTEALRSDDIQQFDIAEGRQTPRRPHPSRDESCPCAGMRRTYTAVGEIIDPIFHQRNQRRDHQRQARQKKRRAPGMSGFSASCGQKAYGVAPRRKHGT